jgi:hypothetical protein
LLELSAYDDIQAIISMMLADNGNNDLRKTLVLVRIILSALGLPPIRG